MSGINRATLLGHVGQKPEIRATASGAKVATFSIATSENWKDRETGERKERTEWHRIVVFNEGLVGIIEKYVDKGKRLLVEGQLRTRKWTGQDNIERHTTEIVLAQFGGQIVLLDGGSGGSGNRPPPASETDYAGNGGGGYAGARQRAAGAPASGVGSALDDEIPF